MSENLSRRQLLMRRFPVVGIFLCEWEVWLEEQAQPSCSLASLSKDGSALPPYPLDIWSVLALSHGALDEAGVPYNWSTGTYPAAYQPTTISEYELANWNAYLTTSNEKHKQAFVIQALWLMAHKSRLTDDIGCWPIPFPEPYFYAPASWLSTMTQSEGISVLVRAYRLTAEDAFLQVTSLAAHTFKREIRNGCISVSLDENGIFFEGVVVYPSAHILNGFLLSIVSLCFIKSYYG